MIATLRHGTSFSLSKERKAANNLFSAKTPKLFRPSEEIMIFVIAKLNNEQSWRDKA